jgi:DNA ligase (NAD+)
MPLNDLVEEIENARDAYWNDEPIISDVMYDILIEELRKRDPENEILKSVEYRNSDNNIKHDQLMLSLEKVYSLEDLIKWCNSVSRNEKEIFVISPKFDGMASCYYHSKGILATRGNGEYGENITDKIPLITFPPKLPKKIYGEIIITNSDFRNIQIKRKDGKSFKNQRNAVSGICNSQRKDTNELIGKVNLTFLPHNTVIHEWTISEINEKWEELVENIRNGDIPLDGIVVKLKDIKYGETLGKTSHHYNHSVAFKFPDESKKAKVVKIDWQVGQRQITPVCYIEPTELDGITVTKITLHNYRILKEFDLCEGDYVSIVRKGGVIPNVISSHKGEDRVSRFIDRCPACNGEVKYEEVHLVCLNDICEGSIKKKLLTSARILEIDGLSKETISKMVDTLNIRNIYDLINLSYSDIIQLEGFAEISSKKLENEILKFRQIGIDDFKLLACLNIDGVATTLSKQILKKIDFEELLSIPSDLKERLVEIEDVGPKRADNIINDLKSDPDLINNVLTLNIIKSKNNSPAQLPLICFSGSFSKPKKFFYEIAKRNNFEVTESVNKNTNTLVHSGPITTKYSSAKKNNVRIIKEEEFLSLYA